MRTLNPTIQNSQPQRARQAKGSGPVNGIGDVGGGRRRRRFMPRYPDLPSAITPFGRVLTDYMWGRRPPMTTHQLALKLGVPKQSTSNWVVRGVLPPFETIMAVLAKLDIPLSTLYSAYKDAGILMPRWNELDTATLPSVKDMPPTPRTRKATVVPLQLDNSDDAPAPLPYTPPPSAPSQVEDWHRIIANTEQTLRQEGVAEGAIAAVIADLRRRQSGTATPIQRNLIAEHTEATSTAGMSGNSEGADADTDADTSAKASKRSRQH